MTKGHINRRPERGIALVLTLAILVIATILVVGFAASMRTERQAASSLANNETAGLIAQAALNHAVALLERNIPQPVPPGGSTANPTNWIINPGLLTKVQGPAAAVAIPLSSNPSAAYTSTAQDAELNVPQLSGTGYTILPTVDSMRVAWIPVLRDPTAVPGAANPIKARYAFWIDDENSKINLNTAYGKPATAANYSTINPNSYTYGVPSFAIPLGAALAAPTVDNPYSLGLPSSVSLDVITGLNRDSLWTDGLQRQLAAPGQIARYAIPASTGSALYDQNKFWLTVASRDPEFNVFGKSRLFLTDSTFQVGDPAGGGGGFTSSSAGFAFASEGSSTGPLRDSAELLTFHGDGNTGSSTSVSPATNPTVAAVTELAGYLNTPWPGYAHTFVEKWSTNPGTADVVGQREAQQVAWNVYGMSASGFKETTNGVWANQTPASAQPAPAPKRFAAMLWDGPKPDPTWPSSRILPQTRSPYVDKFAISFIATQFTRTNGTRYVIDPTTNTTIRGTTKYVVNVRFAPQIYLPLGYQGTQTFSGATARSWNASNDEIYITHFEATVDDGSGSGSRVVRWGSETPTYDNSLYWDPDGGTLLYKFSGNGILSPDSKSYNFATAQTPWDLSSDDNTVQPSSPPPPGYTSRSISFIFDAGTSSRPCTVSNVKIRFVLTTGTGAFITPYQISPIRDIDAAAGFETSTTNDSGAIVFPNFQIPTTNISSNAPDYWLVAETLDPRVNQRGTPGSGPSLNDDWQVVSSTPSIIGPASGARTGRLAGAYPLIGASGDESKLAWLDASPYTGSTTKVRWGMRPSHVNRRLPSVGLLSCLSAGIQSGTAWRTLRFQRTTDDPPDWLLLDLFAVPSNRTRFSGTQQYPDASSAPLTYMNSTAGKINLNTTIFPTGFGLAPSTRDLPLKALLHGAYRPQVAAAAVAQPDESALFDSITTYLQAKPRKMFDYPGEICQVPGFADAGNYEWEKEALIRNLASLITTRSNSFSVFGVAQTVKKNPANNVAANQGIFETRASRAAADDTVTGEKRFRAVVERYVWPGVDGGAGNSQTDATGAYSQLGGTSYVASPTNAIDGLDPSQATFSQAYNPGAAVMRYRVIYFEYLN